MTPLELAANAFNAVSILLAGRNSWHTWWTGIVGCALFGWLFVVTRLYADATLQVFFIVTGIMGWRAWRHGAGGHELPIRHANRRMLVIGIAAALAVTVAYAWLLARLTDAAAPLPDSAVLAFSVLAYMLLIARRLETWWCWLLVNTVAVPLYVSRGLHVTGLLYVLFWLNALVALHHWRKRVSPA